MSQSILKKIAEVICERRNDDDWPCNGLDFDEEMARVALKALCSQSLIHHLTTSEERIIFIAIINKILNEK